MKHQSVTAWEVFQAEPEVAYAVCFQMLAVPPDPEELLEYGAPAEVVQKARVLKDQHFVREEDRPRRFVLDKFDGLVTSRLEMEFAADFAGTWVTQRFSLHPHGFLARLLTAIPRRRLWQAQSSMREQLRYLKSRCEDRSFLISMHSPPEQAQQRRLRARCELLLAGVAYFEILLGNRRSDPVAQNVLQCLFESARLHLILTDLSSEDADLRRIVEEKIHPAFERRLEAGDAAGLSFFVDANSYYMAWARRLFSIHKDGLMSLDGIARGDREVMGKLLLDSAGPPEEEELARSWEKADLKPEYLLLPFAGWFQERQGVPVPFAKRKGSPPAAPPVPATTHRPSRQRIAEAKRHHARGRALIEAAHPGDRAQAEHALAAFGEAAALLTRTDGYLWGQVQMNRAMAVMAQRRPGHHAQDVEEALSACNEALTVFTRREHPLQHALAKIDRGRMMASRVLGPLRSNLEGAIADFRDAAEILDPAANPLPWADAHASLADALVRRPGHNRSANVEKAIAAAQRALTVLDPEATLVDWIHAKKALGDAFAARSEGDPAKNLDLSIEHLEEALRFLDPQAEPRLRGLILHNLAASYLDRISGSPSDNVDKAIALLDEAVALGDAVGDPHVAGHWWMTLGNAYMARHRGEPKANFARAMEAFRRAAEGLRRDDDPHLWAVLRENLGHAWLRSPEGDPDENVRLAIAAFEEALETLKPLEDPRSWVLTQADLGNAYTRVSSSQPPGLEAFAGNLDKAIAAYDAALTRAHREADSWKWAGLHKSRAVAYEMLRLTAEQVEARSFLEPMEEESRASMEKALEVFTLERAPSQHMTGALFLGMVHLRRTQWKAAEDAFASALHAADLLVGGIEVNEAEALETLRSLGRLGVNIPVPSIRLGDGKGALALWESSRARLLTKALHLETFLLSAAERQELNDLQDEVSRIEHALNAGSRIEDRNTLLDRLTQRRRRMKEIVDSHRPPGGLGPEVVEAMVAACTRDGIVIAAPILTEAGSWILLGLEENGRTGIRIVDLELGDEGGRLFEEALRRWLDEAARRSSRSRHLVLLSDMGAEPWEQTPRELGAKLWHLFAGRLVEHLDAAGVARGARLVLLPHGGLGLLPLGLACNPETGEELADCYELSYAPNLTALVRARERAAEAGARPAQAAVIEADSRGNLIASKPEATLVQSWFPAGGPPAPPEEIRTPAQTLALLAGKDLWHFATHGEFDQDDPIRSRLELSAGETLTVADLLQAKALGIPRLAVLSACSTGVYDTHHAPLEFTGLPAGFLQAGAAGVIASLWPVDDVATMLCIGRFYDFFLGEGLRPSAALRQAQQWLRSASLPMLREKLLSWRAEGRISEAGREALSGYLERSREAAGPVYSHPVYWSAFVYYGA